MAGRMRFVPGLAALPAERIFGLGAILEVLRTAPMQSAMLAEWRRFVRSSPNGDGEGAPRGSARRGEIIFSNEANRLMSKNSPCPFQRLG
jgi:hypothetical protein